ncbi:MAG: M67 family metallopeptidase [Rhodospirillales bacterium]|nr:M67 family metallopeptidase [Rhodospirillales bacterium]
MISISAALMEQISKAGEAAYPNECCGLLAGLGAPGEAITITDVHPSDNVCDEQRHDRFEVDPRVRLKLMRALEDGPMRIVGHYHSHPDHPAEPSEHDLKMAFEPDLLWLIVSVIDARATETTAHRVNAERTAFEKIPLSIEDTT